MKRETCPITKKVFDCKHCQAIGLDGKCPYMRLDEWSEETLKVMRELVKEKK